jgi:hypothetical protein
MFGVRRMLLGLVGLSLLMVSAVVVFQGVTVGATRSRAVPQVARFVIRGSNGYLILVSANPKPPKPIISASRPSISLVATRGHEEVDYTTPATVTSTTIDASLGRLGAISVSFTPSGKVLRATRPKHCRMGRFAPVVAETRLGVFTGTIRFRGEHGYTVVHARQAKGGVGDSGGPIRPHEKITCRSVSSTEAPNQSEGSPPPKRVFLDVGTPRLAIGFLASPAPSGSPLSEAYSFKGFTSERRGKIRVSHSVSVLGPASDFDFNSSLTSASVTPPTPFTGTATFQRNTGGSTSWRGSLSARLPVRGAVRFAGPRFSGELANE